MTGPNHALPVLRSITAEGGQRTWRAPRRCTSRVPLSLARLFGVFLVFLNLRDIVHALSS
jgi:hypothetical protein